MNQNFRKAKISELSQIWKIIQMAILRRKAEGSHQWQDGYPNLEIIQSDIQKGVGFVLTDQEIVVGYCAVLINDEPQYARIEGKWLTNTDFVVFHRVAVSEKYLGKGYAKKMIISIEKMALDNNIFSVKADTNFDNIAMIKIFENLGYSYCGEVYFRGNLRKAYEKLVNKLI